MLKIGIIAPPLDTVPSKKGNSIYTIVHEMSKYSRHNISIISIASLDDENDFSFSRNIFYYKKKIRSKSNVERLIGYRLTKYIFGTVNLNYLGYYKYAYKKLHSIKVDIIVQEEFSDLIPYLRSHKKLILHQHGVAPSEIWQIIASKLSHVVFVSEKSRIIDNLKHIPFVNSSVIYNGVDINKFNLSVIRKSGGVKAVRLLFVGRIAKGKGIIELIEAVRCVAEEIELTILGDIDCHLMEADHFMELIKKNTETIKYVGSVTQEELPAYYIETDFLICPSTGMEGLPRVITEAAVMGIPVIASDRGGISEVIKSGINGVIIKNPVNSNTISEAILEARDNKRTLIKNARDMAVHFRDRYSLTNMVNSFDELFEKVISK